MRDISGRRWARNKNCGQLTHAGTVILSAGRRCCECTMCRTVRPTLARWDQHTYWRTRSRLEARSPPITDAGTVHWKKDKAAHEGLLHCTAAAAKKGEAACEKRDARMGAEQIMSRQIVR
ncbi:hypothetical protein NDU88_001987 [Pleurodeles waltl]|uniref:Uncharacterized protein n=1 Tax=Pleurodeles waltl TaxID=8319 RepID=A0AAV7P5E9_PLEWA|nr:hypothetical protein NDU88_001987 [Pleurodeles waltl]